MQILLSEPRFCLCNSTQRGSRSVPDMASGRSNSALWINPEDPLGYRSTLKLSLVTNQVLNSGTPPRNPQRRSRHYPFSPTGFFFFAHCSPALCAKKTNRIARREHTCPPMRNTTNGAKNTAGDGSRGSEEVKLQKHEKTPGRGWRSGGTI